MKKHNYEYLGSGTDVVSGWFRYDLKRDDGKVIHVTKARYLDLLRNGRIDLDPEPGRGGARPGSGRPKKGRKQVLLWVDPALDKALHMEAILAGGSKSDKINDILKEEFERIGRPLPEV